MYTPSVLIFPYVPPIFACASLFDKERVNFLWPKQIVRWSSDIFPRTPSYVLLVHTTSYVLLVYAWKLSLVKKPWIESFYRFNNSFALLNALCLALQYTLDIFNPSWSTFPSSSFSLYSLMKPKPPPNYWKTIGYDRGIRWRDNGIQG